MGVRIATAAARVRSARAMVRMDMIPDPFLVGGFKQTKGNTPVSGLLF